MPIFEYVCKDCNERFEELFSGSGPRAISCMACGGVAPKVPSVCNNTLLSEERKRALSRATGKDINFSHEVPKDGIEMSRKEYLEIKTRRPEPKVTRSTIKKTIEKSVVQVKESQDFRRQMNLMNAERRKDTEKLHEESAKIQTKG